MDTFACPWAGKGSPAKANIKQAAPLRFRAVRPQAAVHCEKVRALLFVFLSHEDCTVGHKSHDPCFHKKYTEAGVMTFVAHCTVEIINRVAFICSDFFSKFMLVTMHLNV